MRLSYLKKQVLPYFIGLLILGPAVSFADTINIFQTQSDESIVVVNQHQDESLTAGTITISQTGYANVAGNLDNAITQTESSAASMLLEQDGSNNVATLLQLASAGSEISIQQNGIYNLADIIQSHTINSVISSNTFGENNSLRVEQASLENTGENNAIIHEVIGNYNDTSIIQLGSNNFADVVQIGSGNTASIEQYGNDQTVELTQDGDNNLAVIEQHGTGNAYELVQQGNNAEIYVCQGQICSE